MLQSLGWAAVGTGFTFLMTTLGAAMVFFLSGEPKPHFQKVVLGFAAGVMTAASVWSLLIPAIEQTASTGVHFSWLPAAVGMLVGVGFLAMMDELLPRLRREIMKQSSRQSALLMTAITLHNIPEGMAVGLAFALAASREGVAAAAALALGIGIQNFPEGAIISISKESPRYLRAQFIAHEGVHGIYFLDEEFRNLVDVIYDIIDTKSLQFLQGFFASQPSLGYDPNDPYLMRNELMAYLLQQSVAGIPSYFAGNLANRGTVLKAIPELAKYVRDTNAQGFVDAANVLESFLFSKYGLAAGRVSLTSVE